MKRMLLGFSLVTGLMVSGCGNPSVESGDRDRDAGVMAGTDQGGEASSLFEVTFGGGEAEVTKNIPADAAGQVGKAVKSIQGKSPPDISE